VRTRFAGSAVAAVSILCASAAATAQIPEKQAQRQLAAASREGLATYEQALKAARAEIEANLDAFEPRKLAERSGVGLTVVLARSGALPGASWADGGVFLSTGKRPITLDTLVATSFFANPGDGVLAVGGQADSTFGSLAVGVRGVDGTSLNETVFADAITERWADNTVFGLGAAPLAGGVYFVTAAQGGGPLEEASIGVR
jgi:hypothetical protein